MPEPGNALVTAAFGRRMRLRIDPHGEVEARIKGRKLRPVCGDHVSAEPIPGEDDWLITAIAERRNQLTRPDARGRMEVLAANLDFLVVICASRPAPDWYIVDRYLCAAELMQIDAAVVYNKADDEWPDESADSELNNYLAVGYDTLICSAHTGRNLERLQELLAGQTAIIVGQSGVGKSSLINALTDADLRTGEVSDKSGEGRHTTVNSVMLPLPGGGQVVDSPGVRDYAPSIDATTDVEAGFREICRLRDGCRFANCRHLAEPSCAIKHAVANNEISERRYESYRRLLALTERLGERRR